MGIVLAKREEERIAFNQTRARAAAYLEKCRPDYIEDLLTVPERSLRSPIFHLFRGMSRPFLAVLEAFRERGRMICCWG